MCRKIQLGKKRKRITEDWWEEIDSEESSCIFHLRSQEKTLNIKSQQFFFLPLDCEPKKSKSCFCSWFIRIILPYFNENTSERKIRHFIQVSTLKQGSQGAEASSSSTRWCTLENRGAFNSNDDSRILDAIIKMKQYKMDILLTIWRKNISKMAYNLLWEIDIVFVKQILFKGLWIKLRIYFN